MAGHIRLDFSARIGLIVILFLMLSILLSAFFPVPVPIPTPWTTAILYMYFAPVVLYSLSALVRPWIVVSLCLPALILGEILWCGLYGSGGELLINVILAVDAWGIGCLLISVLRKRNLVLVLSVGALWSFIGILVPATIYYSVVLHWSALYMIAYSLFVMIFNLVLVPPALVIVFALRKALGVRSLEELLLPPE